MRLGIWSRVSGLVEVLMSSHWLFFRVLVDCMSSKLQSRIDADRCFVGTVGAQRVVACRQHVWERERTTPREGERERESASERPHPVLQDQRRVQGSEEQAVQKQDILFLHVEAGRMLGGACASRGKNRKVRSTLGLDPPSKPQARSATKCLLDLQTRSGRLRLRW